MGKILTVEEISVLIKIASMGRNFIEDRDDLFTSEEEKNTARETYDNLKSEFHIDCVED